MQTENAVFGLAASMVERAAELIEHGWLQGGWVRNFEGTDIPERFCILGALDLASEELFGDRKSSRLEYELAQSFILDEAFHQYKYGTWAKAHSGGSIPGFNDPPERRHEEVMSVLRAAARRLWHLSIDNDEAPQARVDLSQYAAVVGPDFEAQAQQYMQAVLA